MSVWSGSKSHPYFPFDVHTSHNLPIPFLVFGNTRSYGGNLVGQEYVDGLLVATSFLSAPIFLIYLFPIDLPPFGIDSSGTCGLQIVFSFPFNTTFSLELYIHTFHVLDFLCIRCWPRLEMSGRGGRPFLGGRGRDRGNLYIPLTMPDLSAVAKHGQPKLTLFHPLGLLEHMSVSYRLASS
jgi:hypothetical protein